VLQMQFLGGSNDAEVAIWVTGEALGDSLINSRVYVDHWPAKAETAIFTNIPYKTSDEHPNTSQKLNQC
jgi:hypothetical protein